MTTSTQTQFRRGTATQLAAMTPAVGEVVIDTTNKRASVGDGSTAGGVSVPNFLDIQGQKFTAGTVGGSANAITLTNIKPATAYAATQKFQFIATATCTGAVTVNVDGIGIKNIKKIVSGTVTALAAGDITSGVYYEITYDGTQFQINIPATPTTANGAGFTPSDPTGTTSGVGVMMGVGSTVAFTPTNSGKIIINLNGTIKNATAGAGVGGTTQLRYGTGTAPSNAASLTGTAVGSQPQIDTSTNNSKAAFSLNAYVSGLTLGTPIWVDLSVAGFSLTTVSGLSFVINEI